MKHELNMIDYPDWIKGVFLDKQTTLDKIYEKGDFLKSQPKLGDFVPTNKKGEVMESPIHHSNGEFDTIEVMEWDEALDRVIWKGWEVEQRKGYSTLQTIIDMIPMAECYDDSTEWDWYGWETYEQLITSGVKLERIQRK